MSETLVIGKKATHLRITDLKTNKSDAAMNTSRMQPYIEDALKERDVHNSEEDFSSAESQMNMRAIN